ncbi:MAG: aspartoacylase [Endozoicomonas sp.]
MKNEQWATIEKITIVGGTHGNEYLGPYFIQKVEQASLYQDNSLEVSTLLANPEAFAMGQRFIHNDLNRSFTREILTSTNNDHEYQRAREINQLFSPEELEHHFIIDLHSSTANMGITLIVRNDQPFNLHAASYVQQNIPEARILVSDVDREQSQSLNSISKFGLALEIGPLANAVIRHDLFQTTEKVVSLLIKFMTLCKTRQEPRLHEEVQAFQVRERVPYPRDDNDKLTAMVHKDLQDRDYRLLEAGHPIFETFGEESVPYEGEPGYAVFINEAAYYREDVAFMVADKVTLPLKAP